MLGIRPLLPTPRPPGQDTSGFCRKFSFEAICGMALPPVHVAKEERDDGDQLQRGPFPSRRYSHGCPLVCRLSLKHTPCGRTHARTGGATWITRPSTGGWSNTARCWRTPFTAASGPSGSVGAWTRRCAASAVWRSVAVSYQNCWEILYAPDLAIPARVRRLRKEMVTAACREKP